MMNVNEMNPNSLAFLIVLRMRGISFSMNLFWHVYLRLIHLYLVRYVMISRSYLVCLLATVLVCSITIDDVNASRTVRVLLHKGRYTSSRDLASRFIFLAFICSASLCEC
jgi:hypothetical protein